VYISVINEVIPEISSQYVCPRIVCLDFHHEFYKKVKKVKKVKQSHYTPWRLLRERRYSPYSFLISALDEGEWSASRLGRALHSGKGPPVVNRQEAGWASEPVWTQRLQEISFASAVDRTPFARSSSPWSGTILLELPRLYFYVLCEGTRVGRNM